MNNDAWTKMRPYAQRTLEEHHQRWLRLTGQEKPVSNKGEQFTNYAQIIMQKVALADTNDFEADRRLIAQALYEFARHVAEQTHNGVPLDQIPDMPPKAET